MSFNIAEKAWLEAAIYNRAMDNYQTFLARKQQRAGGDAANVTNTAPVQQRPPQVNNSSLVNKIQATRNTIQEALNSKPGAVNVQDNLEQRIEAVENENKALRRELSAMCDRFAALEARLSNVGAAAPAETPAAPNADEDDEDVDLFGSDSEDEEAAAEAEKIKAERIAAYNARKSEKEAKKGALVAKSNIILDVKPWDDETDMAELEQQVRAIETDGLLWGAGKLVAVGYGIKKLQICCVVEDDKVGTDFLEESITTIEDLVQSVDVVAFNKI